jgi:hypothetical protein
MTTTVTSPDTGVNAAKTSRITAESEPSKLLKRIGSTMYVVNVHFSKSSKETLDDKIFRLIQRECAFQPQITANPLQTELPERSFI